MENFKQLSGNLNGASLKSENLSEKVVLWIKQSILDGVFGAGDELPSEMELCSILGVGKSSVREALKMLQMVGVVEIRQGKRTRICEEIKTDVMTPLMFDLIMKNIPAQKLYDFRVMFENAVTVFAMEHITEEGIQRLRQEVDLYHQLCVEKKATVDDEFAFHQAIYEICDNPYIYQIGNLLLDLFKNPMRKAESYGTPRDAKEHEEILNALVEKDMAALSNSLKKSFAIYRKVLGLA